MSCSRAAAIAWRSSDSARRRSPERVHFPGAVLHDTLPDLYRAADLFVLPAVHDAKGNVDGLPNVILEAMASGLAVAGARVSGLPMAIGEGRNGWLMEEGSVGDLGRILVLALGDPSRLAAYGEASRARAQGEFSWDAVAARYRTAYVEARRHRAGKPSTDAGGERRRGNRPLKAFAGRPRPACPPAGRRVAPRWCGSCRAATAGPTAGSPAARKRAGRGRPRADPRAPPGRPA